MSSSSGTVAAITTSTTTSNAVASDNSSDSASHTNKNKSTKSEIEIIDQKMVKCINDINHYKQKIQREWSKQMNSHLKSFYPDDALNESSGGGGGSGGSINKSVTGDSLNNNSLTNSFSNSPQAAVDSAEYDRKINLLTKKLRSYEKRRHKLIYESKQEQDAAAAAAAAAAATTAAANANAAPASASATSQQSNHQTSQSSDAPLVPIDNKPETSTSATTTAAAASTLVSIASQAKQLNTLGGGAGGIIQHRNNSFVAAANPSKLSSISASVTAPVNQAVSSHDMLLPASGEETTKMGASTFYISSSDPVNAAIGSASSGVTKMPNLSTSSSGGAAGTSANLAPPDADLIGDEQNPTGSLIPTKSYQTLDRNMFFIQVEQQLYYLKLQQEKMQSDIDEIHKKVQDNHQLMIKELQSTCSQISEHVHKISFNFYKSCDSKLEDLKSSFDRSIQSFSYNLTHCHRDIKEAKEDVSYMKNKIEIIEKSQKVHSIETNPTNYYQLFYKLLDILLTLATIILLAFTNMIASIKFVFLLYPRLIVMFFLIYFFFFYLIDQEKLDIYFHKILLNDSKYPASLNLSGGDYGGGGSQANLGLFRKLFNVVYRVVFRPPVDQNREVAAS